MDLTFLEVTRWSVVLSDAFSGNLLTWIKIPTTNRPIRHGCGLTYKAMIVAQSTSLHDTQQNDFMSEYLAKPVIVGIVYGTSGFGVCCSVVILLTCIKIPRTNLLSLGMWGMTVVWRTRPCFYFLHDSNDFMSDMTSHIYFHSFFVLIWASV